MSDTRPVLLDMNNPVSSDPAHALYPYPPGCSGWRVWQLIQERAGEVTRAQYLRAFDRRNLVNGKEWSRSMALARAAAMTVELAGREVVVFGELPRVVLGIPRLLIHPQRIRDVTWRQLPNMNDRWYHVPDNRLVASVLLAELYGSVRVLEYN